MIISRQRTASHEHIDICVILRDRRKGHKNNAFYEEYPDIESRAKAFAMEQASSKKASFRIQDLADFIDKTFREEYGQVLEEFGFDSNKQVRSIESCPVDLLKWGAKFENYFSFKCFIKIECFSISIKKVFGAIQKHTFVNIMIKISTSFMVS